jgi:tetratricopeptide (TPR) repeat protein
MIADDSEYPQFEFGPYGEAEQKACNAFELYENGKMTEALNELDLALQIDPANSSWHFNKGLTLDALERHEQAICEYELALAGNPEDVEILNSLAIDYTRGGQYDRAIDIFEKIQSLQSDFEPCYCNRIITYTEMEQHSKAEEMFYLAQQLNPDCPLCYYNIGNSLFIRGNYAKAIWCWNKTATLEPNHPQIEYRIAQAYWAKGDLDAAKQHFLVELRNNPGDTDVIFDLGILQLEIDEIDGAKEKFNRILELDPNYAPAIHYLGEIALDYADYATATQRFLQAIKKDQTLPGPRYRLAQCAFLSGDKQSAREYLTAEMDLCPTDPDVLLSMAWILLESDEFSLAVDCLLQAANEEPDNSRTLHYLGLTLAILQQYDEALKFLERAVELSPENIAITKDCAQTYLAAGKLAQAKQIIASCRELAPQEQEVISLHKHINAAFFLQRIKEVFTKSNAKRRFSYLQSKLRKRHISR